MDAMVHLPVMMEEVIAALNVRDAGRYIDCTFGRGGHSQAILERLGPDGQLVALDQDPGAIDSVEASTLAADPRFKLVHANFRELAKLACDLDISGKVDGILMDLGVSSPQLDDPSRGFAFLHEGPLDMRMNPGEGVSVADWLATAGEKEIADVIWRYGEERYSRRIARAIVSTRAIRPLRSTRQLAELIEMSVPRRDRHKHPATRTFQALRIHVNRELEALEQALDQAVEVLALGGRLVVIAFHSLEDRIVKRFIRREAQGGPLPKGLPLVEKERNLRLAVKGKKRPDSLEVARNPRARSAILRVAERL